MTAFNLHPIFDNTLNRVLNNNPNINTLKKKNNKLNIFPRKNDNRYFSHYVQINYKISVNQNNLLFMEVKSSDTVFQSVCKKKILKVYSYNNLGSATFEYFNNVNLGAEHKTFLVTISDEYKNNTYEIFLEINKHEMHTSLQQFAKNYLLNSYKEDNLIPDRSNAIYERIEGVQAHELTYKIFYEMAIRNINVKKIMNALNYLTNIRIGDYNEIIINEIDFFTDGKKKYKISGRINNNNLPKNAKLFFSVNDSSFNYIDINDKKFILEIVDKDKGSLDLLLAVAEENYPNHNVRFGQPIANCNITIRSTTTGISNKNKKTSVAVTIGDEKYSTYINENKNWFLPIDETVTCDNEDSYREKSMHFLKPEDRKNYLSLGIYTIKILIEEFDDELINKYLIYRKDYQEKTPEKNRILLQRILGNSIGTKNKYFFKEDEYTGYSVHQSIFDDSNQIYDINIIRNDATKYVVDYNISNLQLNLNLPKKELVSYLTMIKDNYDNDTSIIATPYELKDQELSLEYENIKNMKAQEWADTFFIYDHFKSNKVDKNDTQRKNTIQQHLTNYYCIDDSDTTSNTDYKNSEYIKKKYSNVNTSHAEHLSIDTIENRIKLMKSLIEKAKYKILTTKSKITDK